MKKPAAVDHPIQEGLRERWSPRAFSDQAIPHEILRSLFEAARWAPSSSNEQPWAFVVATKDQAEAHAKLVSTLYEGNQVWAKNAPLLGIAVSKLAFAKSGNPNRNAFYDTGAAMADLTLEATSRGQYVHQMGGFDPEKARELFGIPVGWEAIAAFVVGYPGDAGSLPDSLREREVGARTRKPLREFVMTESWGHAAPFLEK